jgi:hypothetical protein
MKSDPAAGASGAWPDALNNPLILDFLDWLAAGPRPYAEVMEAWRTSCPRLPIWEDAVDGGLVVRRASRGEGPVVCLTAVGRAALARREAP